MQCLAFYSMAWPPFCEGHASTDFFNRSETCADDVVCPVVCPFSLNLHEMLLQHLKHKRLQERLQETVNVGLAAGFAVTAAAETSQEIPVSTQ